MRRVVTASAIVCGALAAPALAAPSAGGHSASLTQFSCQRSSHPRRRAISVEAVMRHRNGTQHMAMRFDLQWIAPAGSSPYNEKGGDLGQWRHPTNPPTLGRRPNDVWRVTQKVRDLGSDGTYRFRVDFRWTGVGGRKLYATSLLSPSCKQG